MTTADHFDQAVTAYQGTQASRPVDVATSNYFFIYFDTAKLYPDCREEIDCLDWSKIFLQFNQTQL